MENKEDIFECEICGGNKFHCHQVCHHDVFVNGRNIRIEDLGITKSDVPYGNYVCSECSTIYSKLEKGKIIQERKEKKYKFLLTWLATNNDTFEERIFTELFTKLPHNLVNFVRKQYDGVWIGDVNSIKTYKLNELSEILT